MIMETPKYRYADEIVEGHTPIQIMDGPDMTEYFWKKKMKSCISTTTMIS